MAAMKEHDVAELTEDVEGARAGETGAVVDVYPRDSEDTEWFMLELGPPQGESEPRFIDVRPSQVRLTWRHPANARHQSWQEQWTPERIKALRSKLGMTQAQMAPLIWEGSEATARKNLANLERGHYKPSAAVARTLRRLDTEKEKMSSSA